MGWSLWGLFVVTFAAALAIPGANAGYVIAQTLANGRRIGLLAATGFALASGLNVAIVLSGLGLLLSRCVDVLSYLKWIGVCYLLYLAWRGFTAGEPGRLRGEPVRRTRVFAFAVLVSLTNPKVLLANLLILPLFLSAGAPFPAQALVLVATAMLLSMLVYSGYVLIASRLLGRLRSRVVNRLVGAVYAGAGLALAAVQR